MKDIPTQGITQIAASVQKDLQSYDKQVEALRDNLQVHCTFPLLTLWSIGCGQERARNGSHGLRGYPQETVGTFCDSYFCLAYDATTPKIQRRGMRRPMSLVLADSCNLLTNEVTGQWVPANPSTAPPLNCYCQISRIGTGLVGRS